MHRSGSHDDRTTDAHRAARRIAEPSAEYAARDVSWRSEAAAYRAESPREYGADPTSHTPAGSPAQVRSEPSDTDGLPLAHAWERGSGGEGFVAPPAAAVSGDVAARLLAEILALDLGNLTPIKALTLLHEMQQAARQAVPWNVWVAGLAGAQPMDPDQTADLDQ